MRTVLVRDSFPASLSQYQHPWRKVAGWEKWGGGGRKESREEKSDRKGREVNRERRKLEGKQERG